MENKYIYFVFSSTPYRVGRIIRKFTGETYNHVSISLDKELTRMYGFARRYYHTPLIGGFVHESVSRYQFKGRNTNIRLCRIPVTEEQYNTLEQLLSDMLARQEHYLYNHLSVVTAMFGKLLKAKDAYICVEFGAHILNSIGIDIDPNQYFSVGEVEQLLLPYTIYTGPMPEAEVFDTVYYAPKPVPHPILTSICGILALFERLE